MNGIQQHGPLGPGRISEGELELGYRLVKRRRKCACGGMVTAYRESPAEGVAAHRETPRHRVWSSWWRLYD
jgi:hypothetical protein